MPEISARGENPIGPTCQKIEDLIAHGRPMIERWPGFYRNTLGKDILRIMLYSKGVRIA